MNKKILTIMYLINKYAKIVFFENWYNSFKINFCRDCDVKFLLITDNIKLFEKYKNNDDVIIKSCNHFDNVDIIKTLKFKLCINDNLDLIKKFDYIHYANCNLMCIHPVTLDELLPPGYNIACPIHYCMKLKPNNFKFIYGDNRLTSVDVSYFNINNALYVQAGNLITTPDEMINISNFIEINRLSDMSRNVITKWHDETYFNFYLNIIKRFRNCHILNPWQIYNVPYADPNKEYDKAIKFILIDKKYYLPELF